MFGYKNFLFSLFILSLCPLLCAAQLPSDEERIDRNSAAAAASSAAQVAAVPQHSSQRSPSTILEQFDALLVEFRGNPIYRAKEDLPAEITELHSSDDGRWHPRDIQKELQAVRRFFNLNDFENFQRTIQTITTFCRNLNAPVARYSHTVQYSPFYLQHTSELERRNNRVQHFKQKRDTFRREYTSSISRGRTLGLQFSLNDQDAVIERLMMYILCFRDRLATVEQMEEKYTTYADQYGPFLREEEEERRKEYESVHNKQIPAMALRRATENIIYIIDDYYFTECLSSFHDELSEDDKDFNNKSSMVCHALWVCV